MIFLILPSLSTLKLNVFKETINGYGPHKKELVRYPEYVTLTNYASPKTSIDANFQVSGELEIASYRTNTIQRMLIFPFAERIYGIYEALNQSNFESFDRLLHTPSIFILTRTDFNKPIWGDVFGYVTPPIKEQTKKSLYNSTSLIFNSGRVEAFYIPD